MYLRINGETWKLVFVAPNDPVLYIPNNKYTLGVTIPYFHRIYIANDLYGNKLKSVIAHEVAHAEFSSRGLIVPMYVEEVLADILSDNILDTYTQTNNICRYYGRC